MNTSLVLTRSHLSPNLAITRFVSFAVSVHTSIPKQLPPSQLPLFTPSLTIATLFITTCPSQITRLEQIQNTLPSYCIDGCLLAWLRNFLLLPYLFHPRWKSCEVELFIEHSNSRFESIRFDSLCESIRIDSFCKKIGLSIH